MKTQNITGTLDASLLLIFTILTYNHVELKVLCPLAPAGLPTFGASFEGESKVISESSFEDAWP